jgi:hypothetical protein
MGKWKIDSFSLFKILIVISLLGMLMCSQSSVKSNVIVIKCEHSDDCENKVDTIPKMDSIPII